MELTKEELERKVRELTASITTFNNDADLLKKDLAEANKRLEAINLPRVTRDQFTDIANAIHQVIMNVDFCDSGNYDMDFEIDYDNRISVGSMEFNEADSISDDIIMEVEALFNILEDAV